MPNKFGSLARQDTGLLGLFPRVNLHEQHRNCASFITFCRQSIRQLDPVKGLDTIKERCGVLHLVCLQGPDQMQLQIAKFSFELAELAMSFLDTVLPKQALAGSNCIAKSSGVVSGAQATGSAS